MRLAHISYGTLKRIRDNKLLGGVHFSDDELKDARTRAFAEDARQARAERDGATRSLEDLQKQQQASCSVLRWISWISIPLLTDWDTNTLFY